MDCGRDLPDTTQKLKKKNRKQKQKTLQKIGFNKKNYSGHAEYILHFVDFF